MCFTYFGRSQVQYNTIQYTTLENTIIQHEYVSPLPVWTSTTQTRTSVPHPTNVALWHSPRPTDYIHSRRRHQAISTDARFVSPLNTPKSTCQEASWAEKSTGLAVSLCRPGALHQESTPNTLLLTANSKGRMQLDETCCFTGSVSFRCCVDCNIGVKQ